ncbi:MAG TPA: threonine--tRNA ligase, partial [Clostridiales bacterium]|nr:threonine--tRNA ligase [Clostridiales bacterium]
PVQVKILPISDKHIEYGAQVMARLKEAGIRCELDERPEKIGYKIREARNERVPYMLVVGQKEEENGLVSVRSRFAGDEGQKELELFISELSEEISKRQMREETAAED